MIPNILALFTAFVSCLCCFALSLVYLVERILPFSEIKGLRESASL